MFEITDNTLRFKNRPVAQLQSLPLGVLRDFEETIADFTTADDFEDEHREALKAEYDEGFDAGVKDGEQEAKNKFEDEREKLEGKRARNLRSAARLVDLARR